MHKKYIKCYKNAMVGGFYAVYGIFYMGAGQLSLYLDYTVKGHHPDSREKANSIEKCNIFDKFPTIRLVAAYRHHHFFRKIVNCIFFMQNSLWIAATEPNRLFNVKNIGFKP